MARRYVVADVRDIPPGTRRIVDVAGRSIGVFNVRGKFYALRNRCPHNGGPLCLGRTSGLATSTSPGDYRLERAGEIIRCPWHGWEFDLTTGRSICDPAGTRVKSYPVQVEALQAEVYPVEIDHEVVIVVLGE